MDGIERGGRSTGRFQISIRFVSSMIPDRRLSESFPPLSKSRKVSFVDLYIYFRAAAYLLPAAVFQLIRRYCAKHCLYSEGSGSWAGRDDNTPLPESELCRVNQEIIIVLRIVNLN